MSSDKREEPVRQKILAQLHKQQAEGSGRKNFRKKSRWGNTAQKHSPYN